MLLLKSRWYFLHGFYGCVCGVDRKDCVLWVGFKWVKRCTLSDFTGVSMSGFKELRETEEIVKGNIVLELRSLLLRRQECEVGPSMELLTI